MRINTVVVIESVEDLIGVCCPVRPVDSEIPSMPKGAKVVLDGDQDIRLTGASGFEFARDFSQEEFIEGVCTHLNIGVHLT